MKHGLRTRDNTDPRYDLWQRIHTRCYNPNTEYWEHYGGRGIYVEWEWHRDNPDGLSNFIRDIGERPPEPEGRTVRRSYWSLDRVDNDGPYGPGNWRWATQAEQLANRRTSNPTLCKRGHPFDEVNTYRTRDGRRKCRECGRVAWRRYYAERKLAADQVGEQ